MDGYSFKRLLRKPWLSLVSLVVSAALSLLLSALTAYREEQANKLSDMRESYEIRCVVTDERGTKSEGLAMSSFYTKFVREELAPYIRDLRVTKKFDGSSNGNNYTVIGVSSAGCAKELDASLGGSFRTDAEDFFDSSDNICIVPKDVYDSAGGAMRLTLTDNYNVNDPFKKHTDTFVFEVAGWHGGESGIFIPYNCAQRIGAILSGIASTDSLEFVLSDNSKTEELMEKAGEMFVKVDPSSTGWGYALTVQDLRYKATIAALEQNVQRISLLLPLLSLLGLGAGFLIGFIGTKGESKNYALMRTLGLTRGRLFLTVVFEQQLLSLFACAAVAVITRRPVPALIFFACHLTGCALSVIKPVTAPPTRLLRAQD